ncbi:hypothetical protein N9R79_05895 [Vibrio sp.]|nr:hypothetical protein [Vibrio sp.]
MMKKLLMIKPTAIIAVFMSIGLIGCSSQPSTETKDTTKAEQSDETTTHTTKSSNESNQAEKIDDMDAKVSATYEHMIDTSALQVLSCATFFYAQQQEHDVGPNLFYFEALTTKYFKLVDMGGYIQANIGHAQTLSSDWNEQVTSGELTYDNVFHQCENEKTFFTALLKDYYTGSASEQDKMSMNSHNAI